MVAEPDTRMACERAGWYIYLCKIAGVVKLVDTLRSGRSARKGLEVRVLSPAQVFECYNVAKCPWECGMLQGEEKPD